MTSRTKGAPSDTVVGSATRAKRSASSAKKDASYLSQDSTAEITADDDRHHDDDDDGDADNNAPPKKVAKTAKTPKTTAAKNTKAVAKPPAKKRTRRRSPEVASDSEAAADSLGGIQQQQHHSAGDIAPVLDEKSMLGDTVYPDGPSVLYAAGMYLARNEGAGSAEAAEPTSLSGTRARSGPTAASYKQRATTAETEEAYDDNDDDVENNSSIRPFTQADMLPGHVHMNYAPENMPPAPPAPHGHDEPQDLHEMAHHHHHHHQQHQHQHQHPHDQQHEPEDLHPAHQQHEPQDLHAMAQVEGSSSGTRAPTRQSTRRPATRSRFQPYDTKQTVGVPAAPRSTSSSSTSRHTTAVSKLATRNNDQQLQDDVEGEMEMKRRRNTEAARRSRERKANRLSELEQKVEELEIQNTAMHNELSVVEKERTIFSLREAELNRRIHNLEQSLRDAHDALMARALGHMSVGHLQAVDGGGGGAGSAGVVPGGAQQQQPLLPPQPMPQGMMAVPVVVASPSAPMMAGGGGGGGVAAGVEGVVEGARHAPEDELVAGDESQ
ncbi:hypothetical protein HDU87_003262 [Geranomyces variabilis]|uniref:BZIP domain-containing protein n=1 Tax=Geranomyces variabilis TaxID=109894 RepID=A0AAD5TKV4_9FUNG|nr:hypothetical protein HDU87_003262 [Geranomyces variabilis]